MPTTRSAAMKWLAGLIAAALVAGGAVAGFALLRPHQHASTSPRETHTTRHAFPQRTKVDRFSWPVYGFDAARTHAAPPISLRPPFRRLWTVHADWSLIEFPPVLERGRLFVGTNHGLVLAIDARTGKVLWQHQFGGCIAASPAVARGVVFVGFMDAPPCTGTAPSFLAAIDAASGRIRWRFRSGVIESPPLDADGLVYFGSWDHRVYAVDANTGRLRWSFATGDKVKAGVALAAGTVYVGSYDGRLYALDARRGRLRWSAGNGSLGGLYATPSVSKGRVFVGSTNGEVYAFAASSGRPLWSRHTGSYVYSPVALADGSAFVGSYDHRLYALSQTTGAVRWTLDVGAPVSGAPTVLGRLVYFSTCGSCSLAESNPRARRTFAVDARTGKLVWRFPDGEYSPAIADRNRVYLTGFTSIYGLAPLNRSAQH